MSAAAPVLRDVHELMRTGKLRPHPPLPDDGMFEKVAARAGLKPPTSLFDHDGWDRYVRQVWNAYPAWGYCSTFVGESARHLLPRVLAQIGVGRMIGRVSEAPFEAAVAGIPIPDAEDVLLWGWQWIVRHAPRPHLVPLAGAGEFGLGMVFRLQPASAGESPMLFLDEASHQWCCPALAREGASLVNLAAWRWGISDAKAAHRIARICGLQRPVP